MVQHRDRCPTLDKHLPVTLSEKFHGKHALLSAIRQGDKSVSFLKSMFGEFRSYNPPFHLLTSISPLEQLG